jgi:hypothetical protein
LIALFFFASRWWSDIAVLRAHPTNGGAHSFLVACQPSGFVSRAGWRHNTSLPGNDALADVSESWHPDDDRR